MVRLLLGSVLALVLTSPALAEWPVSGIVVGEPLYWRYKGTVSVVADGAHGVIATTNPWHLASRVDPQGGILWSVDPFDAAGLPAPSLYAPFAYASSSDGIGGVWFATRDTSDNVVAVRFDASGALQVDSVILGESSFGNWVLAAVSDERGGVYVVWSNLSDPKTGEIRATHVDAEGHVTGPANGVVVFGGPGPSFFGAVADGVGGLLVSSADEAGAVLQRLDVTLAPMFGDGGRVEVPQLFDGFSLAATGDGGAFVAWADGPPTAASVRVQRLDASGVVTPGWPVAGAVAAMPTRFPGTMHVIADATGGAYVAWIDQLAASSDPMFDLRVSRVLANGRIARGWQPAGVVVGETSHPTLDSRSVLVADGSGGCYLAWAVTFPEHGDTFVQHLAGDGGTFPGWPAGGLRLGSHEFGQHYDSPYAIPDGSGGVYVAWDELSYPMNYHEVRLTRLSPGGPAGDGRPLTPSLSLARVAPNPVSGLFTVNATLPDERPARLEVFDVAGRVSHVREVHGTGEQGLTLDASDLATGVHWMRLTHPTGVRMARVVVVH